MIGQSVGEWDEIAGRNTDMTCNDFQDTMIGCESASHCLSSTS